MNIKRFVIAVGLIFIFTGCIPSAEPTSEAYSDEERVDLLIDDNTRLSEQVLKLENRILVFEREMIAMNESLQEQELEKDIISEVNEFTMFNIDMEFHSDTLSNLKDYRVVTNDEGTYLVDNTYYPLAWIGNGVYPVDNCWSESDDNILLEINYEWFSEYYIYNLATNTTTKLFDVNSFEVIGDLPYEVENFGFVSNFVLWMDNENMIFVGSYGKPKDGGESEYRERGYRSDVFMYNSRRHELRRLTDAEDGEYNYCTGIDETKEVLLLELSKYSISANSEVKEVVNVEVAYKDFINYE